MSIVNFGLETDVEVVQEDLDKVNKQLNYPENIIHSCFMYDMDKTVSFIPVIVFLLI
jgi:hypothetical protein